jgi:hypothetical protein
LRSYSRTQQLQPLYVSRDLQGSWASDILVGQIGFVLSRQTDGRSQEALAGSGRIYADQYVTKRHHASTGRAATKSKRPTPKIVPKLFLCALE